MFTLSALAKGLERDWQGVFKLNAEGVYPIHNEWVEREGVLTPPPTTFLVPDHNQVARDNEGSI